MSSELIDMPNNSSNISVIAFSSHREEKLLSPLSAVRSDVGIVTVESRSLLKRAFGNAKLGWRMLREEDPDVIIGDHAGVESFVAAILSKIFRKRFVLRLGGNIWEINRGKLRDHLENRNWHNLAIILLVSVMNKITFFLTNGYLAISPTVKRAILENTSTNPKQIGIIGVPVNRERFETGDIATARDLLGCPNKRILLTVTNLRFRGKYKGVVATVDEIEELLKKDDDLVYVVAGDGAYHDKLIEFLDTSVTDSVRNRILCPGYVSNIEDLYAAAEILVYVSFNEGFGNIVQEAQIAGCPVVANDEWGMSDQIDELETGILVPIEEDGALRDAVNRLLTDRTLYNDIREKGRQHAVRVSRPDSIGTQIFDFLDRITSE